MAFKRDKLVEVTAAPKADCSHEGCTDWAHAKVQTATGWANFCPYHYDLHFARIARENSRSLGLKSMQEVRARAMRKCDMDRGSRHWASDILERARRGERLVSGHPITPLHVRLANEASRGRWTERTVGEDDEVAA